jgi:DNA-binding NarL/FixJ family response regulator
VHPSRSAFDHLRALAATNGIDRAQVDEVLDLVGLGVVGHHRSGGFSLGMGQRPRPRGHPVDPPAAPGPDRGGPDRLRVLACDGIGTTRAITEDDDLAGVRVIVLTTFELDDYVVAAMGAGASGFLDKGVDPGVLLDAIRVVAAGDALLTPNATRALLASLRDEATPRPVDEDAVRRLTAREREVVGLVGQGLSNDEIAEALFLSPLTAKTHVSRAMTKLNARDRAQLVGLALKTGLTRFEDL